MISYYIFKKYAIVCSYYNLYRKVQRSERESISKKEKLDFYCRDVEEGVVTKRINYFYELKGNSQDDYKRNYIERESIRRTPICEKLLSEESK